MGMGQEMMDDLIIQDALLEQHMSELVSSKCWETADKRVLKIANMEDGHLKSTIKWLYRNDHYYFADSFISLMETELRSRI
jgi:hypothetical protein